jgi:hypothetical protein
MLGCASSLEYNAALPALCPASACILLIVHRLASGYQIPLHVACCPPRAQAGLWPLFMSTYRFDFHARNVRYCERMQSTSSHVGPVLYMKCVVPLYEWSLAAAVVPRLDAGHIARSVASGGCLLPSSVGSRAHLQRSPGGPVRLVPRGLLRHASTPPHRLVARLPPPPPSQRRGWAGATPLRRHPSRRCSGHALLPPCWRRQDSIVVVVDPGPAF